MKNPYRLLTATLLLATAACGRDTSAEQIQSSAADTDPTGDGGAMVRCAPDADGLTLADGYCLTVFHEGVGAARHVTVAEDGGVWVGLREPDGDGNGIVALRDTSGDGTADVEERFGTMAGSGIVRRGEWLYHAPNDRILRYPMTAGELTPSGAPETLVTGLPTGGHGAKSLTFTENGVLLVNIGSRSNACQVQRRTAGSPGQDPCPELPERAGVWAFDAGSLDQGPDDGERFATGLRNAYALGTHPSTGQVYAVVHGRDQLHEFWPEHYTQEQSAQKPAEQFVAIDQGDDFGWPYCYEDPETDQKVLAPEYGGDGTEVGRCAEAKDPLIGFPAHWAPNDLAFLVDDEASRNGAFVAFHGSWNRAPLPQEGYNVVFVPFQDGEPTGEWEVFAEGFPMGQVTPDGAQYRPTGLATTPDGGLLIVDGQEGRIWKVVPDGSGR